MPSTNYILNILNIEKITPKESFTNAYDELVYCSEHVRTATKLLRVILYAKYEDSYLYKFMENQRQHLTMTQRNDLLKLLQKIEELFNVTLCFHNLM